MSVIIVTLVFFKQTGNIIQYKATQSGFFILSAVLLLVLIGFTARIVFELPEILYTFLIGVVCVIYFLHSNSQTNTFPFKTILSGYFTYLSCRTFFSKTQKLFLSSKMSLWAITIVLGIVLIHIYYSARITLINGFLLNTTLYSNLICLLVPFAFYLKSKLKSEQKINVLLNLLIITFVSITIINTARIAILVCSISFIVYLCNTYILSKFIKTILCLILLTIALTCGIIKQKSSSGRVLIWKISTNMITQFPFGIGTGNFTSIYNFEQSDYLNSSRARPSDILNADITEYAFNDFIQITNESSICALICYLMFITLLLKNIRNSYGRLLIISWLFVSFFSYPLYVYIINVSFNALLAYFVSKYYEVKSELTIPYIKRFFILILLPYILIECLSLYSYLEWDKINTASYKSFDSKPPLIKLNLLHDNSFLYSYGFKKLFDGRYDEALSLLLSNTNKNSDADLNIAIALCFEGKKIMLRPNTFIEKQHPSIREDLCRKAI